MVTITALLSALSSIAWSKTPRSTEWKRLPHQSWEERSIAMPPNVDALGFDRRSVLRFGRPKGYALPLIVSTDKLHELGQILGSHRDGRTLSIGDQVYIRASRDENIQLGDYYTISMEPTAVTARLSKRKAWTHTLIGTVKVIQTKDGFFIGKIIEAQGSIERGQVLIPLQRKIQSLTPIPGPSGIEGIVILDRSLTTEASAQHKAVIIDRGKRDGVEVGMVFRSFYSVDPINKKPITHSEIISNADILVVQTTETHCQGLVLESHDPVFENDRVVLLTDVRDLVKNNHKRLDRTQRKEENERPKTELDELDQLDTGEDLLGKDEERELRQLELWQGNPDPNKPIPTEAAPVTGDAPPTSDPILDSPTPPAAIPPELQQPADPSTAEPEVIPLEPSAPPPTVPSDPPAASGSGEPTPAPTPTPIPEPAKTPEKENAAPVTDGIAEPEFPPRQ